MKIEIKNSGEHGIIRDVQAALLPPNAWSNGTNVAPRGGSMERIGGWHKLYDWGTGSVNAILAHGSRGVDNDSIFVAVNNTGTATGTIYKLSGTGSTVSTAANVQSYTGTAPGFDSSGEAIIFWTNENAPLWYSDSVGAFASIPYWGTGVAAAGGMASGCVANGFVFAGGPSGTGTNASLLAWTDPLEDASGTGWDGFEVTDTNLAELRTLFEGNGGVSCCKPLGDSVLIYKQDCIYSGQFIGAPYVWSTRVSLQGRGALTHDAVCDIGDQHLVVCNHDVYTTDGRNFQSIISDRIRRWFFGDAAGDDAATSTGINPNKIHASYNPRFGEAVIWYEDQPATAFAKALVVNIQSGAVGNIEIAGAAVTAAGLGQIRDYTAASSKEATPHLLVGMGSALYALDIGDDIGGTSYASRVERADVQVPAAPRDHAKFIRAVYPDISGDPVDIYVGGRWHQDDAIQWEGPFEFDPNTDRKLDCRVSCRYPAIAIENGSDARFFVRGYTLDIEILGER